MKTLFCVDATWYVHRYLSTTSPQLTPRRVLNGIFADAYSVGANLLPLAFDGRNTHRYKIYGDYKASRAEKQAASKEGDKGFIPSNVKHACMDKVMRIAADMGVATAMYEGYEADDICASAATQFDGDVIIGVADKDSYQLLSERVRLWTRSTSFITVQSCIKKFGVPPESRVDYQTLIGDDGDDIPAILTPAKARDLLLKYKSIRNFRLASAANQEWFDKHKAELVRNIQLVKLRTDLVIPKCVVVPNDESLRESKDYAQFCASIKNKPKRLI